MRRPKRIQRRRTRGWRMPKGALYVGRPTKWGNPFLVGLTNRVRVLEHYRQHILRRVTAGKLDLRELRDHDLACFCALDQPCHADVLLELANPSRTLDAFHKRAMQLVPQAARCTHRDPIKLFFDHGLDHRRRGAATSVEWCERCGALRLRRITAGRVGPWRLPGKFGGRALLDCRSTRER